jgi:hypothetical protein
VNARRRRDHATVPAGRRAASSIVVAPHEWAHPDRTPRRPARREDLDPSGAGGRGRRRTVGPGRDRRPGLAGGGAWFGSRFGSCRGAEQVSGASDASRSSLPSPSPGPQRPLVAARGRDPPRRWPGTPLAPGPGSLTASAERPAGVGSRDRLSRHLPLVRAQPSGPLAPRPSAAPHAPVSLLPEQRSGTGREHLPWARQGRRSGCRAARRLSAFPPAPAPPPRCRERRERRPGRSASQPAGSRDARTRPGRQPAAPPGARGDRTSRRRGGRASRSAPAR